jgi:hypothetical protein
MLRVVCEDMMSMRLNGTRHPAATHADTRLLISSSQHVWQKKCPQLLSCTALSAGYWHLEGIQKLRLNGRDGNFEWFWMMF